MNTSEETLVHSENMRIYRLRRLLTKTYDMNNINWKSVINMTNGIMGISILAMPYCFSQCGILLGTLSLFIIALLTSYSCKLLIHSSDIKRTKSLEYLALCTLGTNGKIFTELCVISLLVGSLVTYQEALGDSGPSLLAKLFNLNLTSGLRISVIILLTIAFALPLSFFKRIDRLSGFSAISMIFFSFFSLYMVSWAFDAFKKGEWLDQVILWRTSGLLKAIPIFSVSFSCQTILLMVYEELPDASSKKMNTLVDTAMTLVFIIYFLTGLFGYIAFCTSPIHGNIIINIPTTSASELVLFGFVICVLFGFPFMVFPCRASLNTLLFSEKLAFNYHDFDDIQTQMSITETRFKYLTFSIVFITTITAIVIPNMEFVLSLTGATTGSIICYIMPALISINSTNTKTKNSNLIPNILLAIGLIILFVCTLANLYHSDMATSQQIDTKFELKQEFKGVIEPNELKKEVDDQEEQQQQQRKNVELVNQVNNVNMKQEFEEKEKKLLEEQNKLLNELKKNIENDEKMKNISSLNNEANQEQQQQQQPEIKNKNKQEEQDAKELIDDINLKNIQLQNLLKSKIQNFNLTTSITNV